jgi:hypothetical protein
MRLKNIVQALGLPLSNNLSTATLLGLEMVAEVYRSEYNAQDQQGNPIVKHSMKVREELRVDSAQARALLGYADEAPAQTGGVGSTPAQNDNAALRPEGVPAALPPGTKVRTPVAGRAPNGNQPRR